MKNFKKNPTFTLLFFAIFTLLLSCGLDRDTNTGKQLTGKWCQPEIEIKGLPMKDLTPDEKTEYRFLMGGVEKMFEDMCVEYFDDRETGRDSYQASMSLPDNTEKQNEFGEYELLANGKRLVLHTPDNQHVNVELTKLTKTEHQWRLQYADMLKLSGEDADLPEEVPNFAMYLTFKKERSDK